MDMKPGRSQAALLAVIYGNMVLYGFIMGIRGVAYPLVKNTFGVSYNTQGLMVSLISFATVVACALAGTVIGRFGLKLPLMLSFLGLILGMGSMFFSSGFWFTVGMFVMIQLSLGFFEIGLNGLGMRIFTVKSALMLSLLHFFFSAGSVGGPWFASLITRRLELDWRYIYPLAIIPVLILGFITLKARFPVGNQPAPENTNPGARTFTFWAAMRKPAVWGFAIILGLSGAVEAGTINWSGLYLQDVYGFDPGVQGARFVSFFFILFAFSRLIGGFVLERVGYLNGLIGASVSIAVLFILGFGLGERGIWILPVTGFFIAVLYPTVLAVAVSFFKEQAQTAGGTIITIGFILLGGFQYGIGLINRFVGAAWGYRSCLIYAIALTTGLWILRRYCGIIEGMTLFKKLAE